jgi:hypothetical protein
MGPQEQRMGYLRVPPGPADVCQPGIFLAQHTPRCHLDDGASMEATGRASGPLVVPFDPLVARAELAVISTST